MDRDKLQTIVETKRKHLIQVIQEHNFGLHDLTELAIEEYFLGQPNGKYDYFIAKDHFENRVIFETKYGSKRYNYGNLYTEVLRHLFDVHLSEAYLVIKHFTYIELDKLKTQDILWCEDYSVEFCDWCCEIAASICEDIINGGYCNYELNYIPLEQILEKPKTKKK